MLPSAPFRRLLRLTVTALAVAMAAPATALAQCPQTTLGEVEQEVMCPVCGTPLALATEAPQAQEQREFIIDRIEDCRSKEQIKEELVAQFGESVLATPGGDGFNILGYVLPGVAIVAGASGVALVAVTWRRRRTAIAGAGVDLADTDDDDVQEPSRAEDARLDEDLRRYDV